MRRRRYRLGGLCSCEQPEPLAGGPYGIGYCGACGHLIAALDAAMPAVAGTDRNMFIDTAVRQKDGEAAG